MPASPPSTNAHASGSPVQALHRWLIESALPLWSSVGVDLHEGGFFEKIDLQGWSVEAPRRARVVARQIFVFATAARHGWLAHADALVDHGLHFLLERMRLPGGTFAASMHADSGAVADARFDLYEHAFILFALATAHAGRPDRDALRGEADALLLRMRAHWSHPLGGFEESVPRALPLKSNPHMHLLEAALAWVESAPGAAGRTWSTLAAELVDLCLTRFVDARSGAVHECFDGDWQQMPGAAGRLVEPGHQFEWSWLLTRAAHLLDRPEWIPAARHLLEIGEMHGVDRARGVAVNALDRDLHVTDPQAKLWPQTERLKAWHLAALGAHADAPVGAARAQADAAAHGIARYLLADPAGLWREQMNVDGSFVVEDCRASSLYHIVCAIETALASAP